MPFSDDELLDFDMKRLAHPVAPRPLLEKHGDSYRHQLVAARFCDDWAAGLTESIKSPAMQGRAEHREGMVEALRDMAAHFRQGDFLPGGTLYEEQQHWHDANHLD
jgi:hypothetical protein